MASHPAFAVWSLADRDESDVPPTSLENVSCIVCFETPATLATTWHHCRRCSAIWCERCMEQMYNVALNHEDESVELSCPQCRGGVAEMQHDSRVARIVRRLDCADDVARLVVEYENVATELVHLSACEADGAPFFMLPAGAVARIMSRDQICDIIEKTQGATAGQAFRRQLRAENYAGAWPLVLQGYIDVLRRDAQQPSVQPFLQFMVDGLVGMIAHSSISPSAREALQELLQVLEAQKETGTATGDGDMSRASSAAPASRKRRRCR